MSFLVALAGWRHPTPLAGVRRPRAPLSDSPLSPSAAQRFEMISLSLTSVAAGKTEKGLEGAKNFLLIC